MKLVIAIAIVMLAGCATATSPRFAAGNSVVSPPPLKGIYLRAIQWAASACGSMPAPYALTQINLTPGPTDKDFTPELACSADGKKDVWITFPREVYP